MTSNEPTLRLDESPLSVHAALALWACLVAGLVVALGGWDDPRPLYNGWIRLMTLGVTAGLLAWAFQRRHASFGRRLQLAAVVSLILHTGLAAGLSQFDLALAADPLRELPAEQEQIDPLPDPPQVTLVRQEVPAERPEFEQPLLARSEQLADEQLIVERERRDVEPVFPESIDPADLSEVIQKAERTAEPIPLADEIDLKATFRKPLKNEFAKLELDSPQELPVESVDREKTLPQSEPALPFRRSDVPTNSDVEQTEPSPLPRASRRRSFAALETDVPVPASPPRSRQPELASLSSQPSEAKLQVPGFVPGQQPPPDRLAQLPSLPRMASPLTGLSESPPVPPAETTPGRSRLPDLAGGINRPGSDDNRDDLQLRGTGTPAATVDDRRQLQPGDRSRGAGVRREFANIKPSRAVRKPSRDISTYASLPTLNALPPEEIGSGADNRPQTAQTRSGAPGLTLPRNMARPRAPIEYLQLAESDLPGSSAGTGLRRGAERRPALTNVPRPTAEPNNSRRARTGLAMLPGKPLAMPELQDIAESKRERTPAASFAGRTQRLADPLKASESDSASRSEAAIERGLDFLAQLQQPEGNWSFNQFGNVPVTAGEVPNVEATGAATGLVLLAMLGGGYDHYGGEHQTAVKRGLDYLVESQSGDGEIFPEDRPERGVAAAWQVARFYSHGIATLALCEAYGMTGDAALRVPAQRAIDYIEQTQVRSLGGWRYTPGLNSDLSVTGWQLMALKSGELAGLRVNPKTYTGIRRFVESCREQAGNRARFCYNPAANPDDPRTSHGRKPGTVMTSVGLLADLYLGRSREDARLKLGADHLLEYLPTVGEIVVPARTSTLGNPRRDTYYWYYGTQVMYQLGGQHWQAWSDALRPVLLGSQSAAGPLAGSWDPASPVPDKWARFGGRIYVTTMNLLSLEVRYRHLPLYDQATESDK